jgi:hypothetical protein
MAPLLMGQHPMASHLHLLIGQDLMASHLHLFMGIVKEKSFFFLLFFSSVLLLFFFFLWSFFFVFSSTGINLHRFPGVVELVKSIKLAGKFGSWKTSIVTNSKNEV